MSAYLVVRVTVTDPEKYGEYVKHTPRILAEYGGRFIVRGGAMTTVEGPEETGRLVIIEFPDAESAKAMYESEDYGLAKAIRAGAGDAQFVIVDGYDEADWIAALDASRSIGFEG